MINKTDKILSGFLLCPRYRAYRHILLQIFVILITINIFWDTPDEFIFTQERFYAWLIYFLITDVTIYTSAYLLVPRFLLKNQYLKFIILSFVLILFSILLIVFLQGVLFEPTLTGRPEPEQVEGIKDDIFFQIIIGISSVSSIVGIGLIIAGVSALLLFRHWMQQMLRINELESATLQSELSFLKSQINPHFLFNMLNNANIMVDEDPKTASEILMKLDDLLRYQFNESTQDMVSLDDDILFLTDFLDLEKTRRDNFEYIIKKEGITESVQVPPLLFIPFVENAVKHNADSESYVHLTFIIEQNCLLFTCENSKSKNPVKKDVGGLGLTNIRRRLDLLFGKKYSLDILDTEIFYKVNLSLDLNKLFTPQIN